MCVVTPSHSDDESVRSSTSGASKADHIQRVNVAELPAVRTAPEDTPIVIKAAVVKTPSDGLVALNQLPSSGGETAGPFSASGSESSSRSSSLERKKKGARVTLDADGRVVYSSDSLRRRKARGHSTFESGDQGAVRQTTSAFRPAPIGFAAPEAAVKPLSPPPYRSAPAPSVVRTQPDGQQADCGQSAGSSPVSTAAISRSDSYRLANEDTAAAAAAAFQRNDSYRRAQQLMKDGGAQPRLGRLAQQSGFAVNGNGRPAAAAGTGQFITGHLSDRSNGTSWDRRPSAAAQPMSYVIKSPMLVKHMSSPGFIHHHHQVGLW